MTKFKIATPTCVAPLPRTCDDMTRRLFAFASGTGLPFEKADCPAMPSLAGMVLLSKARILLSATRLPAPYLASEARAIADATGRDLILLRWDPFFETSFAVYAAGTWQEQLYFVPQVSGGFLIPTHPTARLWQLTEAGLRKGFHRNLGDGSAA